MKYKSQKVLVILGPTATGKTDIAIKLAKKFNGAIISCDSRQVYKGLDIGSGKYPNFYQHLEKEKGRWVVDGIDIFLYDVADPNDQYSVANFIEDVASVLEKIKKDNKLPIVVGGTGLYLKALLEGLPNVASSINLELRKKLEILDKEQLQKMLQQVNLDKWNSMNDSDKQNSRRLIRYIEIALNGESIKESNALFNRYDVLKIGLTAPREYLYQKVDLRVVSRINLGMIEESKKLVQKGVTYKRLKELGLEYRLLASFLQDEIKTVEGEEGLIKKMQYAIHGYIRRQLTWFKKEKNVNWVDVSVNGYFEEIEKIVLQWYDRPIKYA